jgi:hypothetical protein
LVFPDGEFWKVSDFEAIVAAEVAYGFKPEVEWATKAQASRACLEEDRKVRFSSSCVWIPSSFSAGVSWAPVILIFR